MYLACIATTLWINRTASHDENLPVDNHLHLVTLLTARPIGRRTPKNNQDKNRPDADCEIYE